VHFDDPLLPSGVVESVADEARTLADLFVRRVAGSGGRTAFKHKVGTTWRSVTWRELGRRARAIATWLMQRGVKAGDKVAIVGRTCHEWVECDLGGQLAGAVTVGAYPTLTREQLQYVISHCDARVVFVDGEEERAKIDAVRDGCPALEHVVVWDRAAATGGALALDEVLATQPDDAALHVRAREIEPEGCAVIVYTSGTTGPPKGAMISHGNILSVLREKLSLEQSIDDETMSFLPLAHVAERILGTYSRIAHGAVTVYATSIATLLDEVKEVQPTLFGSVPRIFEKAYDRIQGAVADASPVKQRIFRWAEGVGVRAVDRWQRGERIGRRLRLQYALADRLVFRKLRDAFGGRVRWYITGAAPIPDRVLRFFWAAGFPVFEAYGMTEATVITHLNAPGRTRLGSVGRPLRYCEHRLADDGEVLVRGPCVFMGYYKDEEATRATVDADGWLHTGDVGRIDDDGFLYIVDRKKHIIITAGGKNLTPANIENAIKSEDPLISHVHAHGDRRPYVTALVTLSPLEAVEWGLKQGRVGATEAEGIRAALMADPFARPAALVELLAMVSAADEVRSRIRDAVRRGNDRLSRVEQVKRVALLERELSVEEEELTPTMKVRRKEVETKFAATFARLYEDPAFGLDIGGR
jgi:long-chain acyl-CoA synthetase